MDRHAEPSLDPPDGVGREAEAFAGVVPLRGTDEPDGALLNQGLQNKQEGQTRSEDRRKRRWGLETGRRKDKQYEGVPMAATIDRSHKFRVKASTGEGKEKQ